ncbi:radical SAM protein [Variovorax sp. Sphag1AA]|uniref:radical SAM protein n=1 Tax=Variovorax sp. Sphag1AA TaxID=2587027 RepID=UPI00160E3C4C|nr:radical SAM protein [Variovorax sp. Sphag1AA]MBB3176209.1 radical SAM protein with 4Fe4S-binding SPASM domain [Variovorax sp. Sphag1AA]
MQPQFVTPPKMTVSLTDTCNLDCVHCYADCDRDASPEELGIDEWIRFVDYLVANDFIEIYIEGGEPALKAGFERLLAHCARKLMTMVRTHGTLLDAAAAERWKGFGVGRVFVDVMGASAHTHDALTGLTGSFDKSCNAVRHLVDTGIPVDMLIIMHRRNVDELPDYLQLAKALGAERVGLLRLYPLGRAKRRWSELALSLEEQEAAVAALQPPEGLKLMQSWHPNDANCCWQAATVNARGDSIGCPYLREYVNFGNIRSTEFMDTWHNNALYRQLRSGRVEQSSCSDCHGTEGTRGGCRSTAYAFHGRWTALDPFCHHSNRGVKLDVLPIRLLQASP